MTLSPNRHDRLQGWAVSAIVHGLALTVVLGLMTYVKPVVPKESFTWEVALVEPQRTQEASQAEIAPTQEPAKPTPRSVTPTPIQPKKVTPIVQREIRQPIETIKPTQQTVAVQTKTEPVMPVIEQQPSEVQQTEQSIDESVVPVVPHEVATQSMTTVAPVNSVEAQAAETSVVTHNPDASAPPLVSAAPNNTEPVARESAPQTAVVTSPVPAAKVDHGWLAESLRRRLAEIKRYPSSARLNGQEGKVVLRAVIRADGHLSEVKVHRSSGHEALDNAAVEAIRLACPLHMQQPLGTTDVAVYVPMVYSLGS